MPAPTSKRNKCNRSSYPGGWTPAGCSAPVQLTIQKQHYRRNTIGINKFVYNLCAATHRSCGANHPSQPSWQDIYKALNAGNHNAYPFVTQVASRIAEDAFMNSDTALKNWPDAKHQGRRPVLMTADAATTTLW